MKTVVGSAREAQDRRENGEDALCLKDFVDLLAEKLLGVRLASNVQILSCLSSLFAAETAEAQREIVLEARKRQRLLPLEPFERIPTLDLRRFRDEDLLFRAIDLVESDRRERTKKHKPTRFELFVQGTHAALRALGWIDPRSALLDLAAATEKLTPMELLDAMGTNRVVARSIVRFDRRDLVFWHALSEKLGAYGEIRFELPYVRRSLDLARASDPLERLVRDVESLRLLPPTSVELVDRFAEVLEGNSRGATSGFSLLSSASQREECDAIAAHIASLVSSGVAPDRIAIGITNKTPRTTLREIERALLAHEVHPAFLTPMDVSIFSRLALFLCSASWTRHDALRLVRVFSAGRALTSREEAWRAQVQRSSLSPGEGLVAALVAFWNALPAPESALSYECAPHPDPSCVEEVLRLGALFVPNVVHDRAPAGEPAAEHSSAAFLDRVELLLAHPFFRGHEALDLARGLIARLRTAKATPAQPHGAPPIDGQWFLRLLEAEAQDSPRTLSGAIMVAPFRDLLGRSLHSLFVPSVHEHVFPDPKDPEADSDEEQDKPWIGLRARHERAVDAEYAEFTLCASRAERVVLAYHAASSETRDALPAAIISKLRERNVPSLRCTNEPSSPAPMSPRLERAVRVIKAREQFHGTKRRSREVGTLGPSEGEESTALRALCRSMGGEAKSVSVTHFERAVQCAAMGFYSATLGVREPEHIETFLSPKARGILLHELLESALRATLHLWPVRPRPIQAIREEALRAIEEALRGEAHPLRAVDREKTLVAATHLLDETLSDLDWDPIGVEVRFGKEATLPPAKLRFGEIELTLHGTIDRIDRSSDRRKLRVVDYKSSLLTRKNKDPFSLQVQVYSAALGAGHPDLTIEGGTYLSAKFEPKQGVPFDRARFQDAVAPRAESLLAGAVTPEPIHEAVCEFCAYDLVCRKPRFPVELVEGTSNE